MVNQRGFTLIELIVILFLLSIVLSIGLFSYLAYKPSYQLKSAVRKLQADMQLARSHAVYYNVQYRMVFKPKNKFFNESLYEIQKGTDSKLSDYEKDNQDHTFISREFNEYPGIKTIESTNDPIFHPNGTISPMTTIKLCNTSGHDMKISTSMAGRIKTN